MLVQVLPLVEGFLSRRTTSQQRHNRTQHHHHRRRHPHSRLESQRSARRAPQRVRIFTSLARSRTIGLTIGLISIIIGAGGSRRGE